MNRGSPRNERLATNASTRFNEAPIHESGKLPQQAGTVPRR